MDIDSKKPSVSSDETKKTIREWLRDDLGFSDEQALAYAKLSADCKYSSLEMLQRLKGILHVAHQNLITKERETVYDKEWETLYHSSVNGDWLTIPTAFPSLPFDQSQLYIREDYKNIEEIIQRPAQLVRFLILGNPGTGKSCFLIYLLCKLLQQKQTVILRDIADVSCLLFSGGKVTVGKIESFRNHLKDSNVWYLVDTVTPERVSAKTVFVCPPRKDHFRQFEKYPGRVTLFMPVWTLDELTTLRPIIAPSMSEDVLKDRFVLLGGIPRTIFSVDDAKLLIDKAISNTSLPKLKGSVDLLENQDDISHVLIHTIPVDETYTTATSRFASKFVQQKVYTAYITADKNQFLQFLKTAQLVGYAPLAEKLFEEYCSRETCTGGNISNPKS